MKRIICFLSIILFLCSSSAASMAENVPLSLRDAYHLMDAFESREYESVWEKKALEKENAQHTREWEKEKKTLSTPGNGKKNTANIPVGRET